MRILLSVLFALGCAAGCAATLPPEPVATAPLSAEEALLYENGVDNVVDPDVLEGRWREDWSRELDDRVTTADIVAVVTVKTLRTDTDPGRHVTYRLVLETDREIVGEVADDLSLSVAEADGGFNSVDGNERRILDQSFVLFAKYELAAGNDKVTTRWHLAPATEGVVARVDYLAERRRGVERPHPTRRVVVHEAE